MTTSQLQQLRTLETQLQFLDAQLSFLQQDYEHLQDQYGQLQAQYASLHATPLLIGQVVEVADRQHCVVQPSSHQNTVLVRVSSTVNPALLRPMATVALNRVSYSIHRVLPTQNEQNQNLINVESRPAVTFGDLGGYDAAKLDLIEAVELPIKQPEVFRRLNIAPPNACLLFGPSGTGKSTLVKAIAHSCDCTFINISSSQCVNKYLGEGARMIRDVFKLARDQAPTIIFMDEIDAIATKRYDNATDGDKEVQRILLELLTQLDGFNNPEHYRAEADTEVDSDADPEQLRRRLNRETVKVIFATNKPETLDPALLRTGRCDRKVFVDYPTRRERRLIFQVCARRMSLHKNVDFEPFVAKNAKVTGADIQQVCREAGMRAIRENRYVVGQADFEYAWDQIVTKRQQGPEDE